MENAIKNNELSISKQIVSYKGDFNMKSEFIKRIKSTIQQNKKISEILPIKELGINLVKEGSANEIIDQIVEEPLKKVCKELKTKGIETVMSSANKNNILKKGEKALEREDVEGKELLLDAPTYESAGRGYAWIMINFSNLSDENKETLFSIGERKDSKGANIGEKIIWFVKANPLMYFFNQDQSDEIKNDLDKKFEEHSFILQYNSDRYPKKVVLLRMPINDETTVIDVERYFAKITEKLKQQQIEKSSTSIEDERNI